MYQPDTSSLFGPPPTGGEKWQLWRQALVTNHNFSQTQSLPNKLKFWGKVGKEMLRARSLLAQSKQQGTCYVGPFVHEFGNFLGYVRPFIAWLHDEGIQVHFGGLSIFRPFLVDEKGNSIVASFDALDDYFAEKDPTKNLHQLPTTTQEQALAYQQKARTSGFPYWDLSDHFFYWYVFRHWILTGPYYVTHRLGQGQPSMEKRTISIFPRQKGKGGFTSNNGMPWDYQALMASLSPHVDKIYALGHPSLSTAVQPSDKVEVCLTTDNQEILDRCAQSQLIIAQHSGAVYLGAYTHTPVLVIYQGQPHQPIDIKGISDTKIFNRFLGSLAGFHFAHAPSEVVAFTGEFFNQTIQEP